ncbi:MAG: hypothetical protein ABFR97_10445 [Thermodesulfobacteriota bacterium]
MLQEQINQTAGLVGFADIAKEPIKGWPEYLEEGKGFLATAENAYGHRRIAFTPEILYNLVAMGIEKLIMAMLMKSGNLPYNHTMGDLVYAMEEFLPGNLGSLGADLKSLDAFQEICDPEEYTIKIPTMAEVKQMLTLAKKLKTKALAYTSINC